MEADDSSSVQDDHTILWEHVTKIEKQGKGGGNQRWTCNYCKEIFCSSYSRVKAHLMQLNGQWIRLCSMATSQRIREKQKELDQAEARLKTSRPRTTSLPSSV